MSPLGIVLLVIVILLLFGGVGPSIYPGSPWPAGYGAGYYGIGGLGLVLLILIILVALGRI